MFRHRGKTRTFKHNLQIASLLSFIAGIVNVAGFLSVQRLTTNVTGHFAFFIDEVFKLNLVQALSYFLYIFFFFLGSFVSSFLVEVISRRNRSSIYSIPVIIESVILAVVALWGELTAFKHPDLLAFCLLFAMGLQNSLVTTISNAVVRTTHLTGLFTDLGIELSQLFFYKQEQQKNKLRSSIRLRLTIINFFFLGGVAGGVFYSFIGLYELLIAAVILILGLVYDNVRIRLRLLKRRLS
ncbi:DUF1275 domain-containing protein (plasmid) [Pedobacter sp. BS3]|uniref:YoaK family protein n=1 Tax=Pedobacter sp. BS3 TaxID=2567937 RepID=UPI0011EE9BFC|nr:YoaK family protein [Pedobacter sp. BS3]TZF86078.1 DUF1275 domain-containing protein [Pedobacter sp. BS3]